MFAKFAKFAKFAIFPNPATNDAGIALCLQITGDVA
jgi:hypothetical protein